MILFYHICSNTTAKNKSWIHSLENIVPEVSGTLSQAF